MLKNPGGGRKAWAFLCCIHRMVRRRVLKFSSSLTLVEILRATKALQPCLHHGLLNKARKGALARRALSSLEGENLEIQLNEVLVTARLFLKQVHMRFCYGETEEQDVTELSSHQTDPLTGGQETDHSITSHADGCVSLQEELASSEGLFQSCPSSPCSMHCGHRASVKMQDWALRIRPGTFSSLQTGSASPCQDCLLF